jgi:hypothetical protein
MFMFTVIILGGHGSIIYAPNQRAAEAQALKRWGPYNKPEVRLSNEDDLMRYEEEEIYQ